MEIDAHRMSVNRRYFVMKANSSVILKLQYGLLSLLLFIALGISTERQAHAYVDPGSSLLIIQSIGALASGVVFYFRRRIKQLFTRRATEPAQEEVDPR